MSRIGTKKPPIKNAYYAPQEHAPVMHGKGKTEYVKSGAVNTPDWAAKAVNKSSHVE